MLFTPFFWKSVIFRRISGCCFIFTYMHFYKISGNLIMSSYIEGRNLLGWMIYWRISRKSKRGLMTKKLNRRSSKRFLMHTMMMTRMLKRHFCQNVLTSARKRHVFFSLFCFFLLFFCCSIVTYYLLFLRENFNVDKSNKWWWGNILLGHTGFWRSGSILMCTYILLLEINLNNFLNIVYCFV